MSDAKSPSGASGDRKQVVSYWVFTGLVCLAMGSGGVMDILQTEQVLEILDHLGYPPYFAVMLGVAKVLSVIALLAPGFRRLKEWAYAGIVFDLLAAAISHIAVGDPVGDFAPPIVLLGFTMASYLSRPPSRRLRDSD